MTLEWSALFQSEYKCNGIPGGTLETGLKLPAPTGVKIGVDPTAVNDAIIVGGSCVGI